MEDDREVIFYDKIYTLVCPKRTCKNFENQSTDKSLNRDFALAREIIHDHEYWYVLKIST